MPIKNYFPVFHKLKSGAYSYVWTEKCEKLLPNHYKARCLEFMMREPKPVHWKPDTRKYCYDKNDTLMPVQNHPIRVRYPLQCNYGLWAGEGVVQYWSRNIRSNKHQDKMVPKVAGYSVPYLTERVVYSEILDKWFNIPCTNRAMDQIDDAFGLDYYILKTHERDLNSKLAMDLRRKMLLRLCELSEKKKRSKKQHMIFRRYRKYMIPRKEAEWVGLSIQEALEKAEAEMSKPTPPLKHLIEEQFLKDLKEFAKQEEDRENTDGVQESATEVKQPVTKTTSSTGFFSYFKRGKSAEEKI